MPDNSQWPTFRSADDRSSTLRPDARSTDAPAARSSLDHASSTKHNASGLRHLKEGAHPTRSLTALGTPHDIVLEKMYKHPGKSDGALPLPKDFNISPSPVGDDLSQTGDLSQAREVNIHLNMKSHYFHELNNRDGVTSATPTTSFNSNIFTTKLYDPFDGSPMGITQPLEAAPRNGDDVAALEEGASNDELWSHLSRVLDLQNQITRMHVDMEGVGFSKQADSKGKGTASNAPRSTGFARLRTVSTSSAPGGDIGDEEGVGVVDEEAEKLKAREREFKKLATQFEGRKVAIGEMMSKLDDLSQALTEFHSLQVPKIIFPTSSRNDSISPTISDQLQFPIIVPPGDLPASISPGESSIRPPTISLPVSANNLRPDHAASVQALASSLSRKGPVPNLVIDSIESNPQSHMVDSPTSTISLKLPPEAR